MKFRLYIYNKGFIGMVLIRYIIISNWNVHIFVTGCSGNVSRTSSHLCWTSWTEESYSMHWYIWFCFIVQFFQIYRVKPLWKISIGIISWLSLNLSNLFYHFTVPGKCEICLPYKLLQNCRNCCYYILMDPLFMKTINLCFSFNLPCGRPS